MFTEEEMDRLIVEDICYGDLTTLSLGIEDKRGTGVDIVVTSSLYFGQPSDMKAEIIPF